MKFNLFLLPKNLWNPGEEMGRVTLETRVASPWPSPNGSSRGNWVVTPELVAENASEFRLQFPAQELNSSWGVGPQRLKTPGLKEVTASREGTGRSSQFCEKI